MDQSRDCRHQLTFGGGFIEMQRALTRTADRLVTAVDQKRYAAGPKAYAKRAAVTIDQRVIEDGTRQLVHAQRAARRA